MLRLRRILFPTDLSSCAEAAFTHAAFLADKYGAELHTLYVAEGQGPPPKDWADTLLITPADVAADLGLPLPEEPERRDPPIEIVDVERRAPRAAPAILDYARDHEIDLVVMGTHGRRGVRRMLMGSTAEEVVRLSECPVFTVGGQSEGEDGSCSGVWAVRRVVAPVDFSDAAADAARHAAALAAAYGARLDLLFVVDTALVASATVPFVGSFQVSTDEVRRNAEEGLQALARKLEEEFPGVGAVGVEVRVGRPATAVAAFAAERGADLLVIGTHGRSGMSRLLMGSVAEEVVRTAPCPVFTVKTHGRRVLEARQEAARAESASAPL